jgi:RecB family endonuclease NucS
VGVVTIDGVEQLTRFLELLNRDPFLMGGGPARGTFAAKQIEPQARVLATDHGIVDCAAPRGPGEPGHGIF